MQIIVELGVDIINFRSFSCAEAMYKMTGIFESLLLTGCLFESIIFFLFNIIVICGVRYVKV